ncbi:carboxymuconolactone decarboxylase family protein [Bacteroides sp. OttesenSCG-928-E20]|nr:carboxymuconolactone decarboxylase family protein [Bacteroides sp. OttesenSCG-928-N06]MDL2299751.1 carboxymuconolactone decarboxylase family protein [Bacteroides sp. OttesenSCG-928-E20]MDL2304703.1 carboxymuconolactone decarboxylase family protein [Bacteroides sp. OttesenSCG-928-D19]
MKTAHLNLKRKELNQLMSESDSFFEIFGSLDDSVYSDGVIPKKYKELTGLSISILSRCEECIVYHIQGCIAEKATRQEIIEAIKIGVIGGGSITYPSARLAFEVMKELKVIE